MIATTGENIPGKEVTEILGVVRGNTVRTKNFVKDIGASLKTIIGGEVKAYSEMAGESRDEVYNRMINEAIDMDADAVINIRFVTSMIMQGAAEMLAYGTAVKLKDK
ncbi:MAG: YbjQ family protein [Candidatus Woesearchaeota archaeon]